MDILAAIICWGWLWTILSWRAIAAYFIYKEVVSKKTTREAVFYLIIQGAVYVFVSTVFIRAAKLDITNAITMIMFIVTGIAHLFWGIKSLAIFQKKPASIDREQSQE
jgi:tryptophan-rich sensory protein